MNALNTHGSPLLVALRTATGVCHDAIESQLRLDELSDQHRYVQVLSGFECFLSAWEPRVAAQLDPATRGWFLARSRLAFVRQDLAALDVPCLPSSLGEDALSGLRLDGVASAWGAMYVLEGSALGGQVISRRVQQTLGLARDQGLAYFSGWGSETGAMWRAFLEKMSQEAGTGEADQQAACSAAIGTFEALSRTFAVVLQGDSRLLNHAEVPA